jgi:hypothetical protein
MSDRNGSEEWVSVVEAARNLSDRKDASMQLPRVCGAARRHYGVFERMM